MEIIQNLLEHSKMERLLCDSKAQKKLKDKDTNTVQFQLVAMEKLKLIKDIFGNSYKIIWIFKIKCVSLQSKMTNK